MLKYAAHRFQGEAGRGPDLHYIRGVTGMLERQWKGL
jgi:hypothetical protein